MWGGFRCVSSRHSSTVSTRSPPVRAFQTPIRTDDDDVGIDEDGRVARTRIRTRHELLTAEIVRERVSVHLAQLGEIRDGEPEEVGRAPQRQMTLVDGSRHQVDEP